MHCKEQMLSLQTQNEKLRRDASQERSQNQSYALSRIDGRQERAEALGKRYSALEEKIEELQDENVSLKLKLSDLESELLEERQQK